MPRKPRLGDILVQAGLIDELQLHTALAEQQRWGNRLGVTLVKLGLIDEQELVQALSRKLGAPAVRLEGKRIDPAVLALVPRELAERHSCLPLFTKREAGVEVIYVGMEDPGDLTAIDELSFRTGMRVRAVIVAPTELWEALERSYRRLAATASAQQRDALADTQPHIPGVSEALAEGDALLPQSSAEPPQGASARPAEGPRPGPSEPQAGSPAAPARPGPARVPTRAILQALTQLLLEKDVIGREELMRRIEQVHGRDD